MGAGRGSVAMPQLAAWAMQRSFEQEEQAWRGAAAHRVDNAIHLRDRDLGLEATQEELVKGAECPFVDTLQ